MTNLTKLSIVLSFQLCPFSYPPYYYDAFNIQSYDLVLKNFVNLRKLKITEWLDEASVLIEAMLSLKNLKKIDIRKFSNEINSLYEEDGDEGSISKFLNENLNQFNYVKLPFRSLVNTMGINCGKIQKKYPHIRFRWYINDFDDEEKYDIYEGEFNDKNCFNGKGVYLSSNEKKYDGEWKNNNKNGKGICYYPNGNIKYEGEWKGNKREGKGIYYYQNGDRYEGDFVNSLLTGKGNYFHSDGGRYEGKWQHNFKRGKGIYYFPNGNKYVGGFWKSEFKGNGIYYYASGARYEGVWDRNKRVEGEGFYYHANGSKYEGEWKRDEKGNYYFEDGSICEREWKYPLASIRH